MLTKEHQQRGDQEYAVDRRCSQDMSSDPSTRNVIHKAYNFAKKSLKEDLVWYN